MSAPISSVLDLLKPLVLGRVADVKIWASGYGGRAGVSILDARGQGITVALGIDASSVIIYSPAGTKVISVPSRAGALDIAITYSAAMHLAIIPFVYIYAGLLNPYVTATKNVNLGRLGQTSVPVSNLMNMYPEILDLPVKVLSRLSSYVPQLPIPSSPSPTLPQPLPQPVQPITIATLKTTT